MPVVWSNPTPYEASALGLEVQARAAAYQLVDVLELQGKWAATTHDRSPLEAPTLECHVGSYSSS